MSRRRRRLSKIRAVQSLLPPSCPSLERLSPPYTTASRALQSNKSGFPSTREHISATRGGLERDKAKGPVDLSPRGNREGYARTGRQRAVRAQGDGRGPKWPAPMLTAARR